MVTEGDGRSSNDSNPHRLRRIIAVPAIVVELGLIVIGIWQIAGGDDSAPEVKVGGQQTSRDDVDTTATTNVVVGESGELDVEGDPGQVGLVPAQTEER